MDPLPVLLRGIRRRIALQQWIDATLTAALVVGVLACVWLVATRLAPALGDALSAAVVLAALGLVSATAWAIVKRPSALRAALEADKRLGLNERITSSLQLQGHEGPMVDAVHHDARRSAKAAKAREHFPITLRRKQVWALVPPLVFLLTYSFLPQWNLFGDSAAEVQARVKNEEFAMHVERIENAMKPLKEADDAQAQLAQDIDQALAKMSDELERGEITERQALARVSNLTEDMEKRKQALEEKAGTPKYMDDTSNLDSMKAMADAINEGRIGDAKKKIEEMKEKLEEGDMTEAEKQALQKDLEKLAEKLESSNNSEAGQALANAMKKAAAAMAAGNLAEAMEGMEMAEMSLAEMEALLGQLAQLEGLSQSLGECEAALLAQCEGMGMGKKPGQGSGMGGPGRGRGNEVGELPEIEVGFQPAKDVTPMTKGKMLATVMQQAAPEEGETAQTDYIEGAFTQVQQEAEQALDREEIPPSAREFVRNYFGSLEPEKTTTTQQP